MSGAVGVMAIILLETAVGGAIVLWATGIYGHVRRGFLLLTGTTLALSAVGAWALTRSAVETARVIAAEAGAAGDPALAAAAGPAGGRAVLFAAILAGLMVAWQVLLAVGDNVVSKIAGICAAGFGPVTLVMFGLARGSDPALAIAELALGAVFLGSAIYGLLLGHWYIVERRLAKEHMVRSSTFYVAGVLAGVAAVALSARNPAPSIEAVTTPLFAIPGFSVLLGAGLVAICALISGFVWKLAREGGRSIQAATGMFYLAVIMAFSAEVASKFRFFY